MNFQLCLDEKMNVVNKKMRELVYGKNRNMNQMIDWLLTEKGKQLRPRFMLATALYCDEKKDVTEYAAMLELVHMATLVHDDVIDNADFRRGKLSIRKKFGTKAAVYLGDYILFSMMNHTKISYQEKYRVLLDGMQKLCDGELGQNDKLYDITIHVDEYLKNIEGKTAALFEIAMKSGALLCDAPSELVERFAELGNIWGILFQIQDDLLDILSDEKQIGKPIFQDFYNGIYTLPIIFALEEKEAHNKILGLKNALNNQEMTQKQRNDLLNILKNTNSFAKTYFLAKTYYNKGEEIICSLNDCEAKDYFQSKWNSLFENIHNMCQFKMNEI